MAVSLFGLSCGSKAPIAAPVTNQPLAEIIPMDTTPVNTTPENSEPVANPVVVLKTSLGDISIELFMDRAPITAGNFLALAKDNFYDGVTFHRVIPGFMIQGGDPLSKDADPTNDGKGGPGYFIKDEFYEGSSNVAGTIAMANAGAGTGGSQFFINIGDNTFLDYDKEPASSKHPVFGRITAGMDVLAAISAVDRDSHDRPLENVTIQDVIISDDSVSVVE
ncbi:MAG: peptidylprolyl isomerase [Parcubacteria group bacterium CG10_big_fil_rev_8_21_14_0_10_46_32]|nr:MAG: peptidylprolyl isomerase [Parcubacteria group bacterium CG10_big_fil_rev_8_21_14_0_10_46_32]